MQSTGKFNLMVSNQYKIAGQLLDKMGFKKTNAVHIYSEKPNPDDANNKIITWLKLDPTPKMFQNFLIGLVSGGSVSKGNLNLTHIPFNYTYEQLHTATDVVGELKLYVIDGYCYIVSNIEKANFFWSINLMRYESINRNTYVPPEDQ